MNLNNAQIRNIILLIATVINLIIFFVFSISYSNSIDDIIEFSGPAGDPLSGKKSMEMNKLQTAKVIEEGYVYVMDVFMRNLSTDKGDSRNSQFDGDYRNTISELQLKHNLDSKSFDMIDPPPSVKKYHYSDIILEFTGDYESFTSFMRDLEAYEKLFKVKYIDMSNPVDKNKKLKATDIIIKLELQAMMLNPEKRSGQSNSSSGNGTLKVILK